MEDSLRPNTSSANIHPKLETPDLMDIGGDEETTIATTVANEDDFFCAQKCVSCRCIMSSTEKSMLLECLHPICETCLGGQNNSADIDIGDSITPKTCAICHVTSRPSKLLENKFLLEIASLQGETDKCHCHPSVIATDWCTDCRGYLCEACVTGHRTLSYTQDHTIRSKEEMYQTKDQLPTDFTYICKSHPKEMLNIYCNTCSVMTCRDCQLNSHKEHTHLFVKEFAETSKGELTTIVNKLRHKTELVRAGIDQLDLKNKKLSEKKLELKQQVSKVVNELYAFIRKTSDDLLTELNTECDKRKTAHDSKKKILSDFKEQASYCTDFVEQAVEMSSNTCLVYTKQLMIDHLKRLDNFNCKVPADPSRSSANRGLMPTPDYGVNIRLKQSIPIDKVKSDLVFYFKSLVDVNMSSFGRSEGVVGAPALQQSDNVQLDPNPEAIRMVLNFDQEGPSNVQYSVQQNPQAGYPPQHQPHYSQMQQQQPPPPQNRMYNWPQNTYPQQQQQPQHQQQHQVQQQLQQQQMALVMQEHSQPFDY